MINDLSNTFSFLKNLKDLLGKMFIIISFVLIIYIHLILPNNNNNNNRERMINFDYLNYERNLVTKKMKEKAAWQLSEKQVYFMNGLIRKLKPKSCLEIGVANGGSSILILNALKDIKDSSLVSLDISEKSCTDPGLKTGNRVKTYFPELAKKWSLYTGDLPNKFLVKLNKKFDFAFIDSAHESPGEILNLIEVLPFLNENAIIVLHDIFWHFSRRAPKPPREVKFTPSNIYLLSSLYGDKLLINNELENMGAVFLYKNQKKHYLDYFLLLNGFWEYMPTKSQIQDLRLFIKKYYNNDLFLRLFNNTVTFNQIYINKFKMFVHNCKK
jgi:predicted O-methyltransferase YrrM